MINILILVFSFDVMEIPSLTLLFTVFDCTNLEIESKLHKKKHTKNRKRRQAECAKALSNMLSEL
jgi:hypothetical protein